MKYILLLLTLNAHAFSKKMPGPAQADKDTLVWVPNLQSKKQERSQFCWASAAQMIMSARLGKLYPQCEIVSKVKKAKCCGVESLKCNQPEYMDNAAKAFGIKVRLDLSPTFKEVVDLIKQGKAVGISHSQRAGDANNTGHEVVAYGTYKVKGKEYIAAFDPWTGSDTYMDASYVVGNLAWHQLVSLEDEVVKIEGSK